MVYLTYSTTESESVELYGINDSTVDLLSAWGSVGFAAMVPFLPTVVNFCGVRGSATVGAGMILFCCGT